MPLTVHKPNLDNNPPSSGFGMYSYKSLWDGSSVISPRWSFSTESYVMLNLLPIHCQLSSLCRSLVLTSHLLCNPNHLVPRCVVTVAMQCLAPLWQTHRCNHELCQVLSVGEGDHFVTSSARNGSHPVGNINGKHKRREIGFDVRHAVVVEEECVVDLRPFEVRLVERFDGLLSEGVMWYPQRSNR